MALKKGLGLMDVFCIASGAMISSGLFVLPGLAHARAGPAVVVSYFLGGLLATTGLLSLVELSTAMPKAGGDYFFVARGMGPAVGTVAGLFSWFSLSLKSAFALVGMAEFIKLLVPLEPRVTAAALCVVFVVVNLVGVKEAARFQVALVAALFALILLYVVRGLPAVNVRHFESFAPNGWAAVLATTGFIFVSYGGLLKAASVAEEVKNPSRTIPLGLIMSILVVSVFYSLTVLVTSGVLGAEQLNSSLTPISDGARVFLGRGGEIALGIAAVLAFISTANAGIMAAARYLLAASRDRLVPEIFGRVGNRFHSPYVAVLFSGAIVLAALLLKLDVLVKAASTVLLLTYILLNLSIIVLRESGVQNYRPRFRAPLYPWAQIAGIGGVALVIYEMGITAFGLSAGLAVLGFLIYWLYGRARAQRESALFHLVERVTARELVTGSLEAELKEIIRERDEITLDRFDEMIERSVVLDLNERMDMEGFFGLIAEKLSGRLPVSAEQLKAALIARERETTTILAPGLAVPHVVIEGEHAFDILLARSRSGVEFSDGAPRVHAVFVLVGTRDERNFHLRALSSIAQIVQDHAFERRWMNARGEQALRDLVLLAERRR